ncbi:hypothetical protein H4217_000584 [Coemansia sp. RSA 1939]|nr:hypothetical protein H4217_002761 [Coemansia sp. RSA 1939]KAJ2522694.1 hypothetical protein H4217_000584 [Coemansia sp. RSA 1939]
MALGRIAHIGIDLILLSTALAGIRRSSGYRLKTEALIENKDMRSYLDKYLAFGETALDFASRQMEARPEYFTKK